MRALRGIGIGAGSLQCAAIAGVPTLSCRGRPGFMVRPKRSLRIRQAGSVERCGPGHLSGRLRRRVHEAHADGYPATVEGGTARYVQRAGARASSVRRAAGPDVLP